MIKTNISPEGVGKFKEVINNLSSLKSELKEMTKIFYEPELEEVDNIYDLPMYQTYDKSGRSIDVYIGRIMDGKMLTYQEKEYSSYSEEVEVEVEIDNLPLDVILVLLYSVIDF